MHSRGRVRDNHPDMSCACLLCFVIGCDCQSIIKENYDDNDDDDDDMRHEA